MATTRVYHCGCCGQKLKADRWIYSRWTGNRYCWDMTACIARRKRRRGGA